MRHGTEVECAARFCLWIVTATGCNQAFGLSETQLVDSKPAPRCPPAGMAPQFDAAPHAVAIGTISYYGFDEARTFAVGLENKGLVQGPVDSDALVATTLDSDPDHDLLAVRLAPEGDQLFALIVSKSTSAATVERYDRAGNAWQHASTVPITVSKLDQISAPSHTTPRRIIHSKLVNFSTQIEELVEDSTGAWTSVGVPYTAGDFGADSVQDPSLTPDGLHLIMRGFGFSGENGLYYADRPDLDSRFHMEGIVVSLIGNGTAQYPFLDAGCTRAYFYAVPGIYYVAQ